jgi:galactose oxidase
LTHTLIHHGRLGVALVLGLFSFLALWASPAQALTSTPHGGLLAAHSAKCLAVEGASTAAGARVVQASCRQAGNDQWQMQPNGNDVQLINKQSGLCMAVTNASLSNAAQVVQVACATANNQLWTLSVQGAGYALKAKHSGQCLDVYGASQADGAAAIQWPCSSSANQTFQFERKVFALQAPVAIAGQQSGQCVNVYGGNATAGTAVIQWPCTGSGNDTWTLKPVGQAFNIVANHSGLCMDVVGSSQASAADVQQQPCTTSTSQRWRLQAYNNAWRLVAQHSGQCLNVYGAGTVAGTKLIQYPCVGAANELWTLHQPTLPSTWSAVTALQVDPVAAANLPNGRILAWSAEELLSFGGGPSGRTYTNVVDPIGKTESVFLVGNTNHDMFCPGTAVLPDGRVFVNGGIDSTRTSIYDPTTGAWSTAATMNIGRGYQGTVLNADGTVLTLGGSWSGGTVGGRTGELWNGSSWAVLPGVPADPILTADAQGLYRSDNHLWLHTVSGQRLLHSGPSKAMNWIAPKGNGGQGSITSAGARGDDADSINGNAVQFDVDQILKLGGAPNYVNSNATGSTLLINAKAANPQVTRLAPMAYARAFANSVVLPNGQVVVTGGQTYAVPFSDDNAIYVPELWDPATQVFQRLPAMATPRNYHSVSLLLPDARVWVAGGGLCGGCATNHANYEILTPPYLLNDNGSVANRPSIASVSTTTPRLGSVLSLTTNTPVSSFALVRLSAATHSVNNDQRRVPLVHNTADGKTYTMALPSDPGVLVPGYYMLFAMNAKGVPSVASTVRVLR